MLRQVHFLCLFSRCFFRSLFGGVLGSHGVRFGVPMGVNNREKVEKMGVCIGGAILGGFLVVLGVAGKVKVVFSLERGCKNHFFTEVEKS